MYNFSVLHFLADGRVGGPQTRIVRVHQAMNEIGCDVETIIASPPMQPFDYFARPGMRHVDIFCRKPRAENPILSGLGWIFWGVWRDVDPFRKVMRDVPAAVVHINGAIMISVVLAAILERRIWIWHLNDTTVPRFMALVVRMLLIIGGGKALAASRAVIDYYRIAKNTEVVYPPAEKKNIRENSRHDVRPVLLGVMANLSPSKGVEQVIEAFAIACERNPDLRLSIAGRILENKRWYFDSLQQLVEELRVAGKVEFAGFVHQPLDWMQKLDVFLFASNAEAAPLAVIEALVCGLPIVCGEIPPTREILGGCGILTPLGDARAMANAICDIVENDEMRISMARQAADRGRAVFSEVGIARQYCRIYSELLRHE